MHSLEQRAQKLISECQCWPRQLECNNVYGMYRTAEGPRAIHKLNSLEEHAHGSLGSGWTGPSGNTLDKHNGPIRALSDAKL